jgi:hypothetical protein
MDWFILLWMEFKGYRLAVVTHSCSCTDTNCDRHQPVQYFK